MQRWQGLLGRSAGLFDAAAALTRCALAQLEVWTVEPPRPGPVWVHAGAAALATLPLAWRRRLPLLVAVVAVTAFAGDTLLTGAGTPLGSSLAVLLATYSLARHADLEAALGGGVIVAAASVAHDVRHPQVNEIDVGISAALLVVAWSVGRALRVRQDAVDALRVEAERLREERDARSRQAAAAERARIARELHDVVAHSISVVAVQAGAARWVLDGDPAPVRDALLTIERTSRDALAELRRLLEVLRAEDEETELAPQQGVADVPALVEQVRAAGQPLRLRVEGKPVPLPAGVDLAGFRIVQEGVTNVLKHAPGSSAAVAVRYLAGALEVEVTDDGGGRLPGWSPAASPGHGLAGMRERVELYGGELQAGPRSPRGFAVRARLPLPTGL